VSANALEIDAVIEQICWLEILYVPRLCMYLYRYSVLNLGSLRK
jgi:hypothetical protein